MQSDTITALEILTRARFLVSQPKGWIQDASRDSKGGFCITGAIIITVEKMLSRRMAADDKSTQFWLHHVMGLLADNLPQDQYPREHLKPLPPNAVYVVYESKNEPLPPNAAGTHPGNYLIHWNDWKLPFQSPRTQQDVIRLFDITIMQQTLRPKEPVVRSEPAMVFIWAPTFHVPDKEEIDILIQEANKVKADTVELVEA